MISVLYILSSPGMASVVDLVRYQSSTGIGNPYCGKFHPRLTTLFEQIDTLVSGKTTDAWSRIGFKNKKKPAAS